MNRMYFILTALTVMAANSDSDAAFADLQRFPPTLHSSYAYLTTSIVPPNQRELLVSVIRSTVPSLSHNSYLADQLPIHVLKSNLLRLDLRALGWDKVWAKQILTHYVPNYRPDLVHTGQVPLVVSGLWFVAAVTDSQLTGDMQYQLLYSGAVPKNVVEFKKFWQVNDKLDLNFGLAEGESGVAVNRERLIENHATAIRGYSWQTFDSKVIAGKTDFLSNPTTRPPKHDASELIVAIPKHLGSRGGSAQAYFLANGKGERQEKAPADIVTDSTGIRGVEIRNYISCRSCHIEGIRHPTKDQYNAYITSGARIYFSDKNQQQELDRYLDSPIAKEIRRNQEDYAEYTQLCNELSPAEDSIAYRQMVHLFDAPLSLEQQALELYMEPTEWRLALGNYSRTYQLSLRLSFATQGQPISRQQWESEFALAQRVVLEWNRSTGN